MYSYTLYCCSFIRTQLHYWPDTRTFCYIPGLGLEPSAIKHNCTLPKTQPNDTFLLFTAPAASPASSCSPGTPTFCSTTWVSEGVSGARSSQKKKRPKRERADVTSGPFRVNFPCLLARSAPPDINCWARVRAGEM